MVNFPLVQKMHPKELLELGIIKDVEEQEDEEEGDDQKLKKEAKADEEETWKKRQ